MSPANATRISAKLGVECLLDPRPEGVVDAVRVDGDEPAPLEQQLLGLGHLRIVGVVARLDQDAAEEHRADQAVVGVADRVAEQRDRALTDVGHELVLERVPLHVRVEARHVAEQGALHVGDPAAVVGHLAVGGRDRRRFELRVGEHRKEGHAPSLGRRAHRARGCVTRRGRRRRRGWCRTLSNTPGADRLEHLDGRLREPAVTAEHRAAHPHVVLDRDVCRRRRTMRAPSERAQAAVISATSGSADTTRTSSPRPNGRVRTSARAISPAPR